MDGFPATGFFVTFEHGEVDHPEEFPSGVVDEAEIATQFEAKFAHDLETSVKGVRAKQDQIPVLCPKGFSHAISMGGQELRNSGGKTISRDLGDRQAASAKLLGQGVEFVDLLAGDFLRAPRNHNGFDAGVGLGQGVIKHPEANVTGPVATVDQLQVKAEIGAVDAVILHGVVPAHPRDVADVDAKDLLPQASGERAHDVHDVFSIHKAHLKVNLGELSLPVGTRIFVPEAPHNLEIAIATRDHQDLFKDLWTLGQGIPLARVLAAGHDEVAGAFGTGFDQERGFHFKETFVAEVFANNACDLRTGS